LKFANPPALLATTTLFLNGQTRDPISRTAPGFRVKVGAAPSDVALEDLNVDGKTTA
jgi:hypothetical protein